MDLFFKAASILLGGIILAIIVSLVAEEITGSEVMLTKLFNKPPENTVFDVLSTHEEFQVDRKGFIIFVLGQQPQHQVLLSNSYNFYDESRDKGSKVYVEFDYTYPTGGTGSEMLTEAIKVWNSDEVVINGFAFNYVDVSGPSGTRIKDIEDFIDTYPTSSQTVTVKRMEGKSGRIILLVGGD